MIKCVLFLQKGQGHREGGTMTPGSMDFRGPIGLSNTDSSKCEAPKTFFFGDHLILAAKTVGISVKTFFLGGEGDHLILAGKTVSVSVKTFFFFFEITSFFGPNCTIFSVYFGPHKIGNPAYLSWPRAHVRLSAPLRRD